MPPLDPPPHPHPWRAFAVIAVAIFLTVLDLFIVNVAFPAVAETFGDASLGQLSWVLTGYAIVFAAGLVPAGKLGDLYGRRRFFLGGLAVFLLGSALAAMSVSLPMLLGGRAVQAVGAAVMTPNSLALVLPLFAQQRRPAVIAAWGALAGLGAAAGPPLGGLLAQLDWRLIFLINLPIGIVAVFALPRLAPEIRDETASRLPDVAGAVLLALGIGALTLGFSQAAPWLWDIRVIGSFAIAVGLVVVVGLRSARHPAAVVEPELIRRPPFRLAMSATVVFWAAFAGLLVSNALFLTGVWGYSVLETGFGMTPGPALSAVFAGLSSRLAGRIGAARVGVLGGGLFTTAAVWLTVGVESNPSYLTAFLPAQLLAGAGIGLLVPTLVAITVDHLPPPRLATGIAVYTVFRQVGAALGVAVWVASVGAAPGLDAASYDAGWVLIAALGATTVAIMAITSHAMTTAAARAVHTPAGQTDPQSEVAGQRID